MFGLALDIIIPSALGVIDVLIYYVFVSNPYTNIPIAGNTAYTNKTI
jgi:hypothetical protein